MKLYRTVSEQEYQQLIEIGRFDITSQSVEGKYFAESQQDARQWGDLLFGVGQYRVIGVELADELCAQFHRWERLDMIGPARYAEIEQLRDVIVSVQEAES